MFACFYFSSNKIGPWFRSKSLLGYDEIHRDVKYLLLSLTELVNGGFIHALVASPCSKTVYFQPHKGRTIERRFLSEIIRSCLTSEEVSRLWKIASGTKHRNGSSHSKASMMNSIMFVPHSCFKSTECTKMSFDVCKMHATLHGVFMKQHTRDSPMYVLLP